MKKTILTLALILFSVGNVFAQKTTFWENEEGEIIETSKPIFLFNEETWDFGNLPEGDPYTHEFVFSNIGNEPLVISNVKASCGCTTPDWPKEPILPGEGSTIKVTYNTKGRPGNFTKAITITSNAVTPTKRIFIKGAVDAAPKEPAAPEKPKSIVNE
ncbi:MAG: DUF1573 domain-containing protein [Chitinophagales bacterium]|nr:DUF1573 domain-containing protein [Bacteroidota bacterium]